MLQKEPNIPTKKERTIVLKSHAPVTMPMPKRRFSIPAQSSGNTVKTQLMDHPRKIQPNTKEPQNACFFEALSRKINRGINAKKINHRKYEGGYERIKKALEKIGRRKIRSLLKFKNFIAETKNLILKSYKLCYGRI